MRSPHERVQVERYPLGRQIVERQKYYRQVQHYYVAEGDEDGVLETDADGDGEDEGVFDTDADGDGEAEGEAEADAEGDEEGLLDAEAEEMTVPRFPSRASQR